MTKILHRSSLSTPPMAVRGEGIYLFDQSGKRYLDGSGGAAVSCLGHSDATVKAAIHNQLDALAFAHTGFFTSHPAEVLAQRLIDNAPAGIAKAYLVCGGSEAMESALKLARQYFVETGQQQRCHIIARHQSYHGNTLGALATGGNQARRALFAPLLMATSHLDPCYEFRYRRATESLSEYGLRASSQLETEILKLGAQNVMAFVAETVVGATAGAVPAVPGYFKRIREICDRYGILLILDEVMCGMGRTGTLFACEQEGIAPDIVTIAKGLGAGYQPIGAMLCSRKIADAIQNGSGAFQHGHTYIGHPVAAAAANAVLTRLIDDDLVAQSKIMGARLQHALHTTFDENPYIGDIRGRGLFAGLEIVQDKASKAPFAAEKKIHQRIKSAAFEAGLICYPGGGTKDGVSGDHVLLAPPFIITERQIDELVSKLKQAFGQVLDKARNTI